MLFHDLATASADVAALSGRLDKVQRLAAVLEDLSEDEAPVAVAWLSGRLPQGRVGIGHATLRDLLPVPPAEEPSLTIAEVHGSLTRMAEASGPGSVRERTRILRDLFSRSAAHEQDFLARLLVGELRQGAQEGVLMEALARAADVAPEAVRRAAMLQGDLGAVGRAVLGESGHALAEHGLRVFRPVKPMLAQTARDAAEAVDRLGRAAFETKLDGVRVQVHRRGEEVRVYTRRLKDETEALPEVAELVRGLPARSVVLDGEVLALRPDGRPRPFQETMRRVGRVQDIEDVRAEVPLSTFFFDCLHLNGETLLDRALRERIAALETIVSPPHRVPRRVTGEAAEVEDFLRQVRAEGHEGVMAKALDAPYVAGRRGAGWLKVKPTLTADLVILAAEWGSGRRRGWLSNVHLGARGEAPGDWIMVGKTFKGMTDAMLRWQTARFLELERDRRGHVVYLRPQVVAEVAFDGIQRSPRYPAGITLRFARLKGYRQDKGPGEADTIHTLRELHARWS